MPHARHRELATLAENGEAERVLALANVADIAEAWCDYHDHAELADLDEDDDNDPNYWAVEWYWSCEKPLNVRHDLLLALVARAPGNHHRLGHIGAGPFEDFIHDFNSAEVDWIERHAAVSEPFREALRSMRLPDRLPDDLRIRINRAAGYPPDRWLKVNI